MVEEKNSKAGGTVTKGSLMKIGEKTELNSNEIQILRWMRSECDWTAITGPADHDEHRGFRTQERWEDVFEEVCHALGGAVDSGYDEEFLAMVDGQKIADVIWDQDTRRYLDPFHPDQLAGERIGVCTGKGKKGSMSVTPSESWGGNVGPVVEPNPGREEVLRALNECKDVREVVR